MDKKGYTPFTPQILLTKNAIFTHSAIYKHRLLALHPLGAVRGEYALHPEKVMPLPLKICIAFSNAPFLAYFLHCMKRLNVILNPKRL
jgi:hypothetical protein